ncbi:MAG TPA: hypothetical protein VFQ83_03395 [Candidatus Udaeobacter sp.]|jgi:hypothetical protein|nr:hypothetical protein [Candidatus Udaeobacter sp.]
MKRRIGSGLIVSLFFACASAVAEEIPAAEKISNFSPDKKFAVRISYDPSLLPESGDEIPPEATRKLELISMPGEEVLLDFSEEEGGLKGKIIWSQDSKWFAYALSLGQRVTETRVCHQSGDRFEKLKTEYLGVGSGGDVRNEYVTPVRWARPGRLVLEQFSIFRGGAGDARIQFTVRFDENGKFRVVGRKKIQEKNE